MCLDLRRILKNKATELAEELSGERKKVKADF